MKTEEIDPGIVDLVAALREAGFETSCSCEGGPGHAFDRPTVQIAAPLGELQSEARKLIVFMQRAEACCTVSVHYAVQRRRIMPDASYLQVELWPEGER